MSSSLSRWDIKVQLSPSVFAALGKFSTLQFIHIRMDSNTLNNTNASNPSPTTQWAPNSSAPPLPPPPPGILPHHHAPPPLGPNVVILPKGGNKSSTSAAPTITPPTFSHFRRLKYLAILDIESLDILDQIAECISASSTSLVTLQISFSAKLTSRARKGPAMETTSDSGSDTESEDDVYLSNNSVPPPPPPPATQTTPATALNTNHDALVRNERLAQERALHRIFDLGKKTPLQERVQKLVKRNVTSAEQMDRVAPKDHSDNSLDMKFMDELHAILADLALGAGKADTVRAAEKLQLATGRFLGYLNSSQGMEALANENSTADSELGSFEAAAHLENDQEPVQPPGDDSDDLLSNNPETHPVELNSDGGSESRAFASPVQPVLNDFEERLLEVVDMEHPDTASEGEDQEFVQFDENENQRSKSAGTTPREQGVAPGSAIEAIPGETQLKSSANTDEGSRTDSGSPIWEMSNEEAIQEYIRLNHGVALEALTIQRIPLKTSAICQALNMWSLRHICLLDVGSQRTFWAMLTQLNSSNPLRIRSIHSDDVSPVLLKFVSSLRRVEEVFFHEKSFDAQETSSVPAPVVRIDDISNLVLEKHARHLKRLMIRSDVSTLWNFNKKAIARLAKCRKLTELVIAVDSWHFVSNLILASFYQFTNQFSTLSCISSATSPPS